MTTAAKPATVYLVDDDPSVLKAVGRLLRSAGLTVAAFESARQFLDQLDPLSVGCLVLDVTMPGMTGPQLQALLTRTGRNLPVIFLTGDGDLPMGIHAMKAGAIDFLSKPCPDEALLEAIRRALAVDVARHARRDESDMLHALFDTLTPREHEVMLGVVAGHLNKRIGVDLGMVEATVKIHRARVMGKLKVESVADLVRLYERAKVGGLGR